MSVRRFAALAAVMAGGALAAAPFYQPAAHPPAETPQPASPSDAAPAGLRIAIETRDDCTPTRSPVPGSGLYNPVAPPEEITFHLPAEDAPLPALPRLPILRSVSRSSGSGATIHEPDFSQPLVAAAPTSEARAVPPRRHRIADGDSLSLLALRYLGDERRGAEIAEYNCDLIRDPNLLPVGQWILIPREGNDK